MNAEIICRERHYRRMNKALRLAQSGEANHVLDAAQAILEARMKHADSLGSPGAVRDYLRLLLLLHNREYEVFVVVLLDAQQRVLAAEELFRGTLRDPLSPRDR
jgi:DNA repair protein RadC